MDEDPCSVRFSHLSDHCCGAVARLWEFHWGWALANYTQFAIYLSNNNKISHCISPCISSKKNKKKKNKHTNKKVC